MKCLAQKIETRLYTPGDLLVLFGEVGTELFFIHSGTVQPVSESGEPLRDVLLGAGAFFGEICFLQPGSRRTASIRCVEFCRALVLTLVAFEELNLTDQLQAIRDEAIALQKAYVYESDDPDPDLEDVLSDGASEHCLSHDLPPLLEVPSQFNSMDPDVAREVATNLPTAPEEGHHITMADGPKDAGQGTCHSLDRSHPAPDPSHGYGAGTAVSPQRHSIGNMPASQEHHTGLPGLLQRGHSTGNIGVSREHHVGVLRDRHSHGNVGSCHEHHASAHGHLGASIAHEAPHTLNRHHNDCAPSPKKGKRRPSTMSTHSKQSTKSSFSTLDMELFSMPSASDVESSDQQRTSVASSRRESSGSGAVLQALQHLHRTMESHHHELLSRMDRLEVRQQNLEAVLEKRPVTAARAEAARSPDSERSRESGILH